MAIIIDASVLCAYENIDDIHHKKAVKIIQDIVSDKYGQALVTDYIFDETITVAMRRSDKKNSIELGNFILNSEILLVNIDKAVFEGAWDIFTKTQNLSFTDCSIIAFMKTFDISNLATFDKAFRQISDIIVIDN